MNKLILIACCVVFISCAGSKAERRSMELVERFRVAVLNAGAYRAVGDQAVMDVRSFHEIDFVSDSDLDELLSRSGNTQRDLVESINFDRLSGVESLDFALVVLPAPPAYPSGSVGLHSINWRLKTIKSVPAVKVPERPADWLLQSKNGWIRFTSDPPGARVYVEGKLLGQTPLLAMVDRSVFKAHLKWTEKVTRTILVKVDERNWVHVRAPEDYMAKHEGKGWYKRMQEADEEHGEYFFMTMYIIVMLISLASLFYSPFQ